MMDQINGVVSTSAETENVWGLSILPMSCSSCGHSYLVPQTHQPSINGEWVCPNCAQSRLQMQSYEIHKEPPEKVVRFQVDRNDLQSILEKFVKKIWLRCEGFTLDTLLGHTKPLFLPMWMVDSHITGTWNAEMAYMYQVKSSQDTYDGGRWVSQENLENRLRWEPRLGQVDVRYDNTITQALRDHEQWIARVGNYSLDSASPYQPVYVDQSLLGVPDLETQVAWPLVKESNLSRLSQDCMRAAVVQQQKKFSAKVKYDQIRWSQLFVPVYSTWYEDEQGKRHPVYINGQNGHITGSRIASQKKGWKWAGIIAACGLVVCLLALICLALSALASGFGIIAAVLFSLGVIVLLIAIIPAIQPWLWNHRQHDG